MIRFYLILLGKLLSFNFYGSGYPEYSPASIADIIYIWIRIFFYGSRCGSIYRNINSDPDAPTSESGFEFCQPLVENPH